MDQINNEDKAAEPAGTPAPGAMSRRRFASAGLGSAGALLTIVSAPSMAHTVSCKSPSGTLSGDLHNSHHRANTVICGGRSPSYYKNAGRGEWRAYHNTKFGDSGMFNCTGPNRASSSRVKTFSNTTMLEFMDVQPFDRFGIGTHLAAVWLNVTLGKINFLTIGDVQGIWNEYQRTGGYKPRGGMKPWTPTELASYLSKTYR